ncbi:AraC family transcriptional regulator [Streptomyces millisiae]|uniref:AraC family transcriptional regulator n=1 Tax=Streptomyces millisiae TaxID=3075542 RepID=A0ABU2LHH8_9ACTN|nr:AraC family transcriptional regulator [Streptomyces sp. DSM 44918]MDT0317044.1 AraC family transcriptional regulator [Streptomyces sp. DSM 44918]
MGASEQAIWTRAVLGPGQSLDLITARFATHRYAPHCHQEFAVGVCTGGSEIIDYRGARHRAGPGSIVVLAPGEAHTGAPAAGDGYAYRAFYPTTALLTEGLRAAAHFREPVIDDPELAAALRSAHHVVSRPGDPLEAESRLIPLFTTLARRHGRTSPTRDLVSGAAGVAAAVRVRLTDELLRPPSLAEIGRDLGLSRYQVLRAFREAVGMPPYAWLAQHRVTRARGLLEAGHRPAEVAALVGFADQAHLTRWFRRVVGVTPAVYRNGVQDGPGRGARS